ncbi:sigma-70 family RNA polymerase sigma factor [Bacillus sp. PS06]|nr:sigma-70 family RNA polymerase sigma factor [Bacillus sp. PS06]
MDDQESLILRVCEGDEEAFYELIQPIQAELYRMAFVYTHNENDAIDILQQTLIRAYEGMRNLKEPKYLKTWLTRIVINCSKTYIEKRKHFDLVDPSELQEIQMDGSNLVEEEMDLWQALSTLEEKYKTVLLLRFYQDYTVPEIARILECPEGTVKTHIRRGLKQLKLCLKGVYEDEWIQSVEGHD